MRNIISTYADRFIHERQTRLRTYAVILALAVVVTGFIFWGLHDSGIAMVNETYCGYEEHQHTADCYEQVLVCGLEENDDTGHTHDGSCLTTVKTLSCGLEESEGHTHDEDCFDVNGNLTCTVAECAGHTHTESCYSYSEILTCGLAESPDNSHTHDESCYETVHVCGIPEHEHDITCMSDETADVETERDWEDTLPELTGVWADDVVAVAESQLGYTESEANFQYSEETDSRSGYTRYGAWYGNEYGDWDAMFAAFCLCYAGVGDMPVNSGAYAWAAALNEEDLYMGAETCDPAPGNLVFLNTEGNRNADVVAIITGVDEETDDITVIQGDSNNAVEEYVIEAGDESITGYGILPEQTEDAAVAAVPAVPENKENETGSADAGVSEDTDAAGNGSSAEKAVGTEPEESAGTAAVGDLVEQTVGAVIYSGDSGVNPLSASESVVLSGLMPEGASAAAYPVDVTIGGMTVLAAYDITIYDADGSEYEPKNGEVHVKISNSAIREALNNDAELVVCHINDETSELESVDLTGESDGAVEFDAESFSIYIVGEDESYYDLETGETVTVYTVEFYQYEFDAENESARLSEDPVSVQYVTGTGYLNEPAVPEYEHHVFEGWFAEMQTEAWVEPVCKLDFGKTLGDNLTAWLALGFSEVNEDHTVKLYTDYDPIYYVYFMTAEGSVLGGSGSSGSGGKETGDVDDGDYTPYVFHTEEYHENNSVLDASTAGLLYWQQYLQTEQNSTYAVVDWYYYDAYDETADQDGKVLLSAKTDEYGDFRISGDMTLYPVIEGALWIYFDMGIDDPDEVYVVPDPTYVMAGEDFSLDIPKAERPGYALEGWYTEDDALVGSFDDNGDLVVADDVSYEYLVGLLKEGETGITLYAKWTGVTVSYTINIWRQKATDGQTGITQKAYTSGEKFEDFIGYYDFAESFHVDVAESSLKTGDSLADVTPTDRNSFLYSYTQYGTITDNSSAYFGFEYAADRTLNNVKLITVAGDGSTIINIFYDRVTITWTFGSGSSAKTLVGLYGTNCFQEDDPAGDYSDWPDPGSGYIWTYNSGNNRMTFETTFVIIDSSASVTFSSTSQSEKNYIYYYLEVTNENQRDSERQAEAESYGVEYERTVNDTEYIYVRRAALNGSGGSTLSDGKFTLTDKYTGYKVVGYTRVEHNKTDSSTNCTAARENDEVTIYSSGFLGIGSTYYDLYIFNDAREYTITLESNSRNVGIDNDGSQFDAGDDATYTFKYGADLTETDFPEGLDAGLFGSAYYYEFTGEWWEDPTFSAVFQKPDTMPANNLVAYADWELQTITVTFVSSVDSNLYDLLKGAYGEFDEEKNPGGVMKNGEGSYSIKILASSSLDDVLASLDAVYEKGSEETGRYTFVSWLNDGSIFNMSSHLYEDTVLTASWNDVEKETHTLTYDLNLPEGETYDGETSWSDGVGYTTAEDSGEELKLVEDVFNTDNTGAELSGDLKSRFICWNTKEDGAGTDYYPDELYNFVNDHTDVTLYAKWSTKREADLQLHYNYPGGYNSSVEGEKADPEAITVANLDSIDLSVESGIHADDEITINGVTYRFAGWSTENKGSYTEDDVVVEADAVIAVDDEKTEGTGINDLYAVWLAELQFGIQKTDDVGNELNAEFTLSYTAAVEGTEMTYYYSYDEESQSYSWISKVDEDDIPSITIGEIQILDHDGAWTTNTIFTLAEISPPEGYLALPNEITFQLDANSNVVIVQNAASGSNSAKNLASSEGTILTVKNESDANVLYIFKYTGELEENGFTALPDAEFVLTRTVTEENEDSEVSTETTFYGVFDGSVVEGDEITAFFNTYTFTEWTTDASQATTLVTGTEGVIHLEGLAVGEYCLTETKAPDGYMLLDDAVRFTLSSDGNVTVEDTNSSVVIPDDSGYVTLCIENKSGEELPKTGGAGIWMFTALGLVMVGGAGYLLCRKKKAANR